MNDTKVLDNSTWGPDELSLLRSWIAASESIMSFLTAAPCGMAADIYGRKRILQLSIAGIILAQAFDAVICAWIYTTLYSNTFKLTNRLTLSHYRSIPRNVPNPLDGVEGTLGSIRGW